MVGRRGVARRTARRTTRRVSRRQAALRSAFDGGNQDQAPPPPPAQTDADGDEDDRYAKLREAKELLDAGILTQEEFEAEKSKILGS
jgi:hypothetical protein